MPVGIPLLITTGEEGSQVTHLIGAILTPTHPASLHPLADDRLAGRFHRTGADGPALGLVTRVVHPMHLILEIRGHLRMDFPNRLAALQAHSPQSLQHHLASLVFEPVAPLLDPLF